MEWPTFLELTNSLIFFSQYIITDQNDGTSATVSEAAVVLTESSDGRASNFQASNDKICFGLAVDWPSLVFLTYG